MAPGDRPGLAGAARGAGLLIPVSTSLRRAARLVAAAALAAAAGVALPGAPAGAAGCSGSHGVTVVVDFHELGGGVQSSCLANGGGKVAADLFPPAGFPLTYVNSQPGFVCRVSGKPASDPCQTTPPADAYWGLWWSNGTSGSWSYASSGAGSQRIPDGGSVAFSWNGSTARSQPGQAPPKHAAASSPQPTPKPQPKPTPKPSSASTPAKPSAPATSAAPSASSSTSTGATPTVRPSHRPSRHASRTPSRSPSAAAVGEPTKPPGGVDGDMLPADPAPAAAAPADDSLPGWVGPAAVVVLFAAGATAAVVRRRRAGA